MFKRLLRPIHAAAIAALLAIVLASCGSGDETTDQAQSSSVPSVERAALQKYHWYLEAKAGLLVTWVTQLRGQIVAGEVGKAESRYATSRVQYSMLEPAAQMFPALDSRINGHPGQQPGGEFVGFHRIEQGIFGHEETAGLKPLGKALLTDVGRLHHAIVLSEPTPLQIAGEAEALLREDATAKIAGKEEVYSHLDLVDISANIEAAEAAFEAVRPLLADRDLPLVQEIEAQFVETYAALQPFGAAAREPQGRAPAAGARFVPSDELSPDQVQGVAKELRALADLSAQARNQLETNPT